MSIKKKLENMKYIVLFALLTICTYRVNCEPDEFDLEEWMDDILNVTNASKDVVVSVENKTLTIILDNFGDSILKRFHRVGTRSLKGVVDTSTASVPVPTSVAPVPTSAEKVPDEPPATEKCDHPLCEAWSDFLEYVLKMDKLMKAIKHEP